MVLHGLGFLGIALYIRDFANALGGIANFGNALLTASYLIRWEGQATTSLGTQLNYFGWIAIALTWFEYRRGRIGRVWLVVAAVHFAANLVYIDRTRPIWIVFTAAVLGLLAIPPDRPLRLARIVALGAAAFGGIFLVLAVWIGKVVRPGQFGETVLPLWAQNLYNYGTGGFAYFSQLVGATEPIEYLPVRALYPGVKVLAALGAAGAPPSQINEFFFAPFPTNVGTFLEPYYRDGGLAFACAAIVVHSFGIDYFALKLLRSQRPLALFAWANLCFVSFIAFFTPKLTNFPVWLFTGLGIAAAVWATFGGTAHSTRRIPPIPEGGG